MLKNVIFLCLSCAIASNWAVLVSTSSAWHDYRHTSNVLSIYQEVRKLGIPEENIILLTAGNFQCNARNIYVGSQMVFDSNVGLKVMPDYKGQEVTTETLHRVLTNRGIRKGLKSDYNSNVLLYLTGHGGDGALGFQDSNIDVLSVQHLNEILRELWIGRRYANLMVMVDSCQSESMIDGLDAPNMLAAASARRGKPSFSLERNHDMGITLIDEFSSVTAKFLADLCHDTKWGDFEAHLKGAAIDGVVKGPSNTVMGRFFTRLNTITI